MKLFDFVNSISYNKKDYFLEAPDLADKVYPPYMVNRALSLYPDCIMHANEMNQRASLDKKLQFDYYLNNIRPVKRFAKWVKKTDNDDLEIVQEYYGYSNQKAKQALSVLSKSQINSIKEKLQKGGYGG